MADLIATSIALVAGVFVAVVWCVHAIRMSRADAHGLVPLSGLAWGAITVVLVAQFLMGHSPHRVLFTIVSYAGVLAVLFALYAGVTGIALLFRPRLRSIGLALATMNAAGLVILIAADQLVPTP